MLGDRQAGSPECIGKPFSFFGKGISLEVVGSLSKSKLITRFMQMIQVKGELLFFDNYDCPMINARGEHIVKVCTTYIM